MMARGEHGAVAEPPPRKVAFWKLGVNVLYVANLAASTCVRWHEGPKYDYGWLVSQLAGRYISHLAAWRICPA